MGGTWKYSDGFRFYFVFVTTKYHLFYLVILTLPDILSIKLETILTMVHGVQD
jgi:hypothetical protein